MWQAHTVQSFLQDRYQQHSFDLEIIKPEGDVDKHSSLMTIGGRGVFTSALQVQLLDGSVDMAVHSTKDLPSLAPAGIAIAAFPQREDARDALISRHGVPLDELPVNPVIGTSSRRRAVQILAIRPDARIKELRGNIDTRLRKARSEAYDAVILAAAGLTRMGWQDEITSLLEIDQFVPAPGQGALAIEARVAPDAAWPVAASLDDADVRLAVATERAFLRGVGGGCTTPVGAHASVERMHGIATVRFWGMLASDDGGRLERVYDEFSPESAEDGAFAAAQHVMRSVAPKWSGVGERNPLSGVRVLITGAPIQAEPLAKSLADHGAEAVQMPTIEIAPVEDREPLRIAIDDAVHGNVDWLVLTSGNAVAPLKGHLGDRRLSAKVAVVGARTAAALDAVGIASDLVSEGPGADILIEALSSAGVTGKRILCLLSEKARPVLADGLQAAGADVRVETAYRNLAVEQIPDDISALIRAGEIGAITFASPSAVESFRELISVDLPALSGAAFIAIGPTTADALRTAGLPVHGEAERQDSAGFINALLAYFGTTSPQE